MDHQIQERKKRNRDLLAFVTTALEEVESKRGRSAKHKANLVRRLTVESTFLNMEHAHLKSVDELVKEEAKIIEAEKAEALEKKAAKAAEAASSPKPATPPAEPAPKATKAKKAAT
jgi:hypothetical protein